MTEPTPPPTRLDEARAKLHAALVSVLEDLGWPAERALPLPPWQPVPPMGWVDVPTVAVAAQEGASMVAATFPVAVVVDGAEKAQVQQLDKLLAHGWQALQAVEVSGAQVRVLTAGPQFLETGAGETRAVVFSVQVTLLIRTLCSGSITVSNPAP